MAGRRQVLVLGAGNLLMGDDGVGVHVARALQSLPAIPGEMDIQVLDVGTSPDIAILAERADHVIIVDAVRGGGLPGTVYVLGPEDLAWESRDGLSLHQRSLADSLGELAIAGPGHHPTIIGIEPKSIALGTELSPEVAARLPQVMEALCHQLQEIEKGINDIAKGPEAPEGGKGCSSRS